MTKISKYGVMLFVATVGLQVSRVIFNALPLADNYVSWFFSLFLNILWLGAIPYLIHYFWIARPEGHARLSSPIVITTDDHLIIDLGLDPRLAYFHDIKAVKPLNPLALAIAPLIGILLFYTTMLISALWQSIIGSMGYVSGPQLGTIFDQPIVLVMEILCTAILPGMFEEIADRGILTEALGPDVPDGWKVALIAIFFGLAHQSPQQLGYAIYGGAILAYVAIKTKSILPTMIIHFTNNLLAVLVSHGAQHDTFIGNLYDRLFASAEEAPLIFVATFLIGFVLLYMALKEVGRMMPPTPRLPVQQASSSNQPFASNQPSPFTPPFRQNPNRARWYEYIPLASAVLVALLGTIFGFIWGTR